MQADQLSLQLGSDSFIPGMPSFYVPGFGVPSGDSMHFGQFAPGLAGFAPGAPPQPGPQSNSQGDSQGAGPEHSSDSGGARAGAPPTAKCFRARQKERMSCLEREVAQKKAEYAQLAAENVQLAARASILERVVACRDEQLSAVAAFEDGCRAPASASSCFGSGDGLPSATAEAQQAFKSMKKEQVIPQYKAFLSEVSGLLLHCQHPCSDASNPVVQKLTSCVERIGHTLKHLVLLNTPLMRQLQSLSLETQQPAAAAEAHWDGVVAALALAPQQRADIMVVYGLYARLMEKVHEERRLIRLGDLGGEDLAVELELAERLAANLSKEHSAQTLLCCFLLGKVLAPAQFAKVAVHSYPFFPDSLALASAVARMPGSS